MIPSPKVLRYYERGHIPLKIVIAWLRDWRRHVHKHSMISFLFCSAPSSDTLKLYEEI